MKNFFSQLNFPRSVILTSVLAALVLAWFTYKLSGEKEELTRQENQDVPKLVKQIQELALNLNQLQSRADFEGIDKQKNMETYIRSVTVQPEVSIGEVSTQYSESPAGKGIVDKKYLVKPMDRTRNFNRIAISNFLYRLEEKTRGRIRVTRVKIDPQGKLKPEEIGKDQWTFEAQITSREPIEAPAAPAAGAAKS